MSRRRAAARLLLVLAPLLLGELAFRAYLRLDAAPDGGDEAWRARYRRLNETLYMRSDLPELIYEPRPDSSVTMEYGRAHFNSAGMRDDREHPVTHGAAIRVALMGDSLVWSEFVSLGDSMGRRLQEDLGDGYEVLSFGVTGYDTAQEAAWYERAVRPFHPDVVVLVYCMNDMMIMSGPFGRYAGEEERALKREQEEQMDRVAPVRRENLDTALARREREAPLALLARLRSLYSRWRFEAHYVDEYLVAGRDPTRRRRVDRALGRFASLTREDHARALLVVSPVLESWGHYHWRTLHRWVRAAARRHHLAVVDPLDTWRASHRPQELRVSGDDLHYSPNGHRIFAATLAREVREAAR